MTQIKKGLTKSPSYTHVMHNVKDTDTSKDKNASPELISLMKAAASNILSFAELWQSIRKKGTDEGFTEPELEKMFVPMVKNKLTEHQIRYLFNQEKEQERARQNRQKAKALRTYTEISPKKDIEQPYYEEAIPVKEKPYKPIETENHSDLVDKLDEDVPITAVIDLKRGVEHSVSKGEQAQDADDAEDLPPEMQAIAAKQAQREVVEEGPPFRVAIVEKDLRAARDLVMRELTKLKGSGWKIIEVRTKRIT